MESIEGYPCADDKIFFVSKNIKSIEINKKLNPDKETIIIDFYNVYCSFVKFNKYKTFSRETVVNCLNILLERFKKFNIIIVSKIIFEIESEYIKNMTKQYSNVTYVLVEDKFLEKCCNRERDDYVCILIHKNLFSFKNKSSVIMTNDKLRNFDDIISNTKAMNLIIYNQGQESCKNYLNSFLLRKLNEKLKKSHTSSKINLCKFKFI